jgi:hypothetical protein
MWVSESEGFVLSVRNYSCRAFHRHTCEPHQTVSRQLVNVSVPAVLPEESCRALNPAHDSGPHGVVRQVMKKKESKT